MTGGPKVDLKMTLDSYAAPRGTFRVLEVPPLNYLMIDGHGDPNTAPVFTSSLETLYPVAYALKFASKAAGHDYVVPPLEALRWAEDMRTFTSARDKSTWDWTLMLLVPEWSGPVEVATAIERAARKSPPRLEDLRFDTLEEGLSVQTLHVGSFDDEAEALARMHEEFVPAHGLRMTGRHHEIYFGDTRRPAPEKMRTLLRQPVERV